MDEKPSITADTLELLWLNQHALRAAIEELALWVRQRGSTDIYENAMVALATLDANADAITSGIESLRS